MNTGANLYQNQGINNFKTWLLMSAFLVLIVFLGWFMSLYYGSPIILYVAFIFSLAMNFFSYWYSDKVVLKITGAKPASREEYFDLYTSVENLSITAGLKMPKVYIINDPVPNAFATGRNENHAAVAFTTGLLNLLDKPELEGVVAHELSHIGNKDILLQTVIVVLVGLVVMLSDFFLRMSFYGGNRDNDNKAGIMIVILGIVLMILSPIAATVIQLAISRKREFLADSSGALLTRYPEGLASALQKISNYNLNSGGKKMKKANHATAHLFFSNPFGDDSKSDFQKIRWFDKIFMTHPPTLERISALLGNKK